MRRHLPPLWLSASALAAALTAAFGVARWVDHFRSAPHAEDFRVDYVAAQIGVTHGWSHLYDLDLQRQLSAGFGPLGSVINSAHNYVAPPLLAWLTVPMTAMPLPVAFFVWSVLSVIALIAAWWLISPGKGLSRVAMLLIAFAIYPVHYAFWLGQTVVPVIFLLALTWWLLERDRWAMAGGVMTVALFVKPQSALLLPIAVLISGRWKPVASAALVGVVLLAVSVASLGSSGISDYLHDLSYTGSDPLHSSVTFAFLFGRGPGATSIEAALGVLALALAWYRRDRMDLVFALGIAGTAASASYFHEYDPAVLLVPAWIVLRSRPSMPQRIWVLAGIPAAQFISIGVPAPMLLWEAVWIGMLGVEPWLTERWKRAPLPAREHPGEVLPGAYS